MAAFVTGASSGVGLAAAEAFAAAGHDVAVSARSVPGLEEAAERVRAHGRRAVIVPADLTDRTAVQAAVDEAVAELGSIDVLAQCAAAVIYGRFDEIEADDFDRIVNVTFLGAVNVIRAALPELERSGGAIVVVGSLMSKLPLPMLSSYSAAKHAERGFLNTLHAELRAGKSQVSVSMLHPGAINTPIWDEMPSPSGEQPRRPPEGYDPNEVAAALVDLAEHPRREATFGAETKLIETVFNSVRPAGDLLMSAIYHYFRSGDRQSDAGTEPLHDGAGRGIAKGGIPITRPSVTNSAQRLLHRVGIG